MCNNVSDGSRNWNILRNRWTPKLLSDGHIIMAIGYHLYQPVFITVHDCPSFEICYGVWSHRTLESSFAITNVESRVISFTSERGEICDSEMGRNGAVCLPWVYGLRDGFDWLEILKCETRAVLMEEIPLGRPWTIDPNKEATSKWRIPFILVALVVKSRNGQCNVWCLVEKNVRPGAYIVKANFSHHLLGIGNSPQRKFVPPLRDPHWCKISSSTRKDTNTGS